MEKQPHIKPRKRRKRLIVFSVFVLVLLGLYLLRHPLLRSCATFLITEDSLQKADAIFVLSGGGYDRGNEAVKVFKQGYAPVIICTGGLPVKELKTLNMDTLESDLTAANLRRQQVPGSNIVELRYGTSTHEESDTILGYCKQHGFKRVIIVSSKLHTRRVNSVFRKKLLAANIKLVLHGASSSSFDEMHWWQSEDGLIAVNNEWIKTFYYLWKY